MKVQVLFQEVCNVESVLSQIVADECWNAFGLIVFLSQCNRSRPSPGEHEEDMMSSWIQRVVLGCVSRTFQLRLLFLSRAKLMKYYSQFQHYCICDQLMYFMCTCVRCVCVSMCAWVMGGGRESFCVYTLRYLFFISFITMCYVLHEGPYK